MAHRFGFLAALATCFAAQGLFTHTAAAAFAQATCSSSGWDAAIPIQVGAAEFIKQSTDPPGSAVDMTLYNHNTKPHAVYLKTNSNVVRLQPYYGYFVTELNYDKLTVQPSNGMGGTTRIYSGALNTSTTALVNSGHDWYVEDSLWGHMTYYWYADINIANDPPPAILQATPKCKSSQTTTATNAEYHTMWAPEDFLFIKSGDVFYFQFDQPANVAVVLSMDTLNATSGADFDLYVSTSTATPDDSNYQWRGYSSDKSEALLIPANSSSRRLYAGIHSYTGAGHVRVTPTTPKLVSANVCVTNGTSASTLTSTQAATLRTYLQYGSSMFFGFTHGIVFRNQYTLNTNWSGNTTTCTTQNGCDVCIVDDASGISY
ncbi:MAG: hypothetical protein ABI560_05400, partial [Myxococcales bacterium]